MERKDKEIDAGEQFVVGGTTLKHSWTAGWGTRIRTSTNGARTRRPAVRRSPSVVQLSQIQGRLSRATSYRVRCRELRCIPCGLAKQDSLSEWVHLAAGPFLDFLTDVSDHSLYLITIRGQAGNIEWTDRDAGRHHPW